jgi:hypothetical protein
MKRFIIGAALLLGALPFALAQDGGIVVTPLPSDAKQAQDKKPVYPRKDTARPEGRPTITYVEPAMAKEPGRISIQGTNLGLIMEVRVNGTVVPVVRNDGTEIVITPGNQDPGIARLELVNADEVLSTRLNFRPSLHGRYRGNKVQVALDPGLPGFYFVNYSFKPARFPGITAGVYYMDLLDMTTPHSGMLVGGFSSDGAPMAFPWSPIPHGLQGVGGPGTVMPMNIQAFLMFGDEYCWSNMLTLQPVM